MSTATIEKNITEAPIEPELNVLSPVNLADPYPYFRRLHREAPVYFDKFNNAWVISSYEYVSLLLKDSSMSVNRYDAIKLALSPEEEEMNKHIRKCLSRFLLNIDNPEHGRLRRLTKSVFYEKSVENMRGYIQEIADEFIAQAKQSKTFDIVTDYAYPLPIRSVCKILGLNNYDIDEIKSLSDDVSVYIGSAGRAENCVASTYNAIIKLSDIFFPIVFSRKEDPKDDLISLMLQAEDNGNTLSDDEVVANCILFLVAGFETVTNLIACGILALQNHGSELDKFLDNTSLIDGVIDESLRFYPPVNRTARLSLADFEMGGSHIKKNDLIILLLGAGNRDPKYFPNPDNFLIDRKNRVKNLAFGAGIHHCIGHHLARLEGSIAIKSFTDNFGKLNFKDEEILWRGNSKFRGLKNFPIYF